MMHRFQITSGRYPSIHTGGGDNDNAFTKKRLDKTEQTVQTLEKEELEVRKKIADFARTNARIGGRFPETITTSDIRLNTELGKQINDYLINLKNYIENAEQKKNIYYKNNRT